MPWLVLTDKPEDFRDLNVRAIQHAATGPMAIDYLRRLPSTGNGAAAYHDKRFALRAALATFDTAVYVDADSRILEPPRLDVLPPGIAAHSETQWHIAQHLAVFGEWRQPFFKELAEHLTGSDAILRVARWCPENLMAITRDGRESLFFAAWDAGAKFLQSRRVYSGEGGVIGLAAACAGWKVNFEALRTVALLVQHGGGGPKEN